MARKGKGTIVKRSSDEFNRAVSELREILSDVLKPLLEEENGKPFVELIENQLDGIEKFYELLLAEQEGVATIDGDRFNLIVEKYRIVLRFFSKFPELPEKSTYKMSVISDFYYLLSHHTKEWGKAGD